MAFELIEGSGISQFRDIIKQLGYNKDVDCELGTVTTAPPALQVQIDNMKIPLDADDLIVAQHLTRWTEKVALKGLPTTVLTMKEYTRTTKETETSPPVTEEIYEDELDFSAGDIVISEFEIEHLDELKVGDRVIVASANAGQRYFVLDRVGNVGGAT
jgi:hypothetical protein